MCHQIINVFFYPIYLCYIMIISDHAPFCHRARNKANNVSNKTEGHQFKSGCMSYSNLKHNKSFKQQVEIFLSSQFNYKISIHMIKTMKYYSTLFIDLIVFYDNSKQLIFKVLGVVVYLFLENMFVLIICVYRNNKNYLCQTKGLKTLRVVSFQELAFPKFY